MIGSDYKRRRVPLADENKNACPVGGATEQAKVEDDCGSHIPNSNFITINSPCQVHRVVDLLSHGAENAICLSDLEKLTGRDGRSIRKEIHRERRRGVPVVSGNSDGVRGYFIAATSEELHRFARSMAHRASEILAVARAAEKAAAEADGQGQIEGW